jgi:hypothetical protein
VPAGVLHQIQRLGIVEHVLDGAGIPCHVHARHLRAFFGPWAPAVVYVPEAHAEAARELDDAMRSARTKLPRAAVS